MITSTGALDTHRITDRRDRFVEGRHALDTQRGTVHGFEEIIGTSAALTRVLQEVELVALTDATVLIYGETGTGKELLARALHHRSPRRPHPFVPVNCAAIPPGLLESELFGHEKGAFTGATVRQIGKFVQADGGTIFLDEIGDMSARTQAKVLRVLENGEVEPVGMAKTSRVDVRVIAATNKDLKAEIAAARFREDLYFRLNVVPLRVPPLRERAEDIPALARHFVEQFSRAYGRVRTLGPESLAALQAYRWPGNVRELKNVIERMVILTPSEEIGRDQVRRTIGPGSDSQPAADPFEGFTSLREGRESFERQFILKKLDEAGGNVVRAAELLGLERSNLYRKMRAYGIRGGEAP